MPRAAAAVRRQLTTAPFAVATAVAAGLLTRRQLQGDAWRRLLPGRYLRGRGAVGGRSAAALWGATSSFLVNPSR